MSRITKLAVLLASVSLVAAGAPGAAPLELASLGSTPYEAPEGIEQGLWQLLPEEDRRAILGEPYPTMFAATPRAPVEDSRSLEPPPGFGFGCLPLPSVPNAC